MKVHNAAKPDVEKPPHTDALKAYVSLNVPAGAAQDKLIAWADQMKAWADAMIEDRNRYRVMSMAYEEEMTLAGDYDALVEALEDAQRGMRTLDEVLDNVKRGRR